MLDIETYPNWMLVLTRCDKTGKIRGASAYGADATLDNKAIKRIWDLIQDNTIATYNGAGFDLPILTLMLYGRTCAEVNKMSNAIIVKKKQGWMVLKQYGLRTVKPKRHVDTMAICPALRISLKSAGARLHSKHIIDLPINPASHVTREEADQLTAYCKNDLAITADLVEHMYDRIVSRTKMGLENATAMSDAKIAEYYMKKEGGTRPPHGPPNDWFKKEFKLLLPQDLVFANGEMQGAYDLLRHRPFHTDRTGNIINDWKGFGPKDGSLATQKYGDMTFKIGVGGLHSQETGVARSNVYSLSLIHI